MTTINVQTPCGPAVAEFDGDRFIRATGEDGNVLLTVPVAMIDGWREVLRERERAAGMIRQLRNALDALADATNCGVYDYCVAEADTYLAAHDAQPASTGCGLPGPTPSERNWTEDFAHENGQYERACFACNRTFVGHKRRIYCKTCAQPAPAPAQPAAPTPEPQS